MKYPPPPTRYGPARSGQPRRFGPTRLGTGTGQPPPPTRFATALQAKSAPGPVARTQPPPPVRYGPSACPPPSRPVRGTIQRMEAVTYFGKAVDDSTGSGINYRGQEMGDIVIREERSFLGEEEAKFLRNLSAFFFFLGNEVASKEDAEVEAMFVNGRILLASNNPKTMQSIYEYALQNKTFSDFVLSSIETGKDERGSKTVESFTNQLMSTNFEVESRYLLQAIMLERTKEYVKLATIRNTGLTDSSILSSSDCEGKLILIQGLSDHAEQKLLLALVKSNLPKNVGATIRGKKRPCFGCWLCLTFARDVLGYSNLNFNPNPGLAWKGAIKTLKKLVDVAKRNNISKKIVAKWENETIKQYTDGDIYTYVSSGYGGTGKDQGWDTGSEDENIDVDIDV